MPDLVWNTLRQQRIQYRDSHDKHWEDRPSMVCGIIQLKTPLAGTSGVETGRILTISITTHTEHIEKELPEIAELLSLPPGYRFLKSGNYLDVWFDSALLKCQ